MNSIKINFLPITQSVFHFRVFRKKVIGKTEAGKELKNYRLYENKDSTKRDNYEVSLQERNGYEEYSNHSNHSISLTNWFLFNSLKNNLTTSPHSTDFHVYEKRKIFEIGIIICRFPEGQQVVTLTPYYLSSKKNFGFLINFRFHSEENQKYDRRVQQLSLSLDKNFRSNKDYYIDKHKLIFSCINSTLVDISSMDALGSSISISNKMLGIDSYNLDKKQYIFSSNRYSYSQFSGIKNHGPYEKINDDIHFIFIFEKKFTQLANELFLSLIGKRFPGTFSGMKQMFGITLNKDNVEKIIIVDYGKETLTDVIKRVKLISRNKRVFSIFIEDYNEEKGNSEPYYFMKYHFMEHDIPLQVINYNKLSLHNTLKWSASNIGLQIFSKLGGKPWIVNPSNRDCLIIGIGSSHKINHETNEIQKYFAYSICLDSSGLYKRLQVLSESKSKDEYLNDLEENLSELLKMEEFSKYKKCVLHLPFKIKNYEIDTLSQVIKKSSNMTFQAVKINTKNKYFGYSNHNTLVPYESTYVNLDEGEFLVWFEGLQYGKENVDKRLSNPVHIKFLNLSENKQQKLDYKPYLQDILNLSGANWRGFNAKSVPISIFYSKLISEYVYQFGNFITNESKPISNDKPWFL